MKTFLIVWIALVVLIAIGMILSSAGGFEAFADYAFVPAWRRRWGGGPPPWAGWRHNVWARNRWGWRWPEWGWGRYGWGPSWGYDPRVRYVTYVEPFANPGAEKKEMSEEEKEQALTEERLIGFPPNAPAEFLKAAAEPYQLLRDELPSVGPPDVISKVTAQSCFMGNFERLLEPTANYRQMTNNFKHGYPDSCTSPFHELVGSFYKGDGMRVNVPAGCV